MDSLFKENSRAEVSKTRRRKKKSPSQPKFIDYNQDQIMLLPPSLEELIPENHLVRVVNKTIESMNIKPLKDTYKGGGRSAYNPLMLLKILIFAYLMQIYSSRRIAKALREDINFMWLSGMQRPDFRTINNFRSGRLKSTIEEVFGSMIIFLSEKKYINLENYFVDGTKIEANASKYSYQWSKNVKKYKDKVEQKVKELLAEIDLINQLEDEQYGDRDLEEIGDGVESLTIEEIEQQVKKLNQIVEKIQQQQHQESKSEQCKSKKTGKDDAGEEEVNNRKNQETTPQQSTKQKAKTITKTKRIIKQIERDYIPRLKKYNQQIEILKGRSSYSKTDWDATFFRTKTGQLLPSYNLIIGTEGQIIINYSIHQKASETDHFIGHMEKLNRLGIGKPKAVITDAGYGSEENYRYLESQSIEGYLKYAGIDKKSSRKAIRYRAEDFRYDREKDVVICPEGRELRFSRIERNKTKTGYLQQLVKYQGECEGCRVIEMCAKTSRGRTISINKELEDYRQKARERLGSKKGIELRKRRGVEVESVFGDIKQNQKFRRFNLRGIEKVNAEFGLVAMAHNIKKIAVMTN